MYSISALDVTRWGENLLSQALLPVLARKLLHATGGALRAISFPGYESISDPGWDGIVQFDGVSPWTPNGQSFWEVSCDRKVAAKASRELKKRMIATPGEVQAGSTFVFVTTRPWRNKDRWRAEALRRGRWADIRVYDAQSLSHWIEESPGVALWLNAMLGRSIEHLGALEDHWSEWASVTKPTLPFEIFAQALEENRAAIDLYFDNTPEGPLHIGADTRGEAAAFAAGLILFGLTPGQAGSGVVLKSPAGVQWAKAQTPPPLIVVADPALEPLLGDLPYRTRVLVATDKASPDSAPPIQIEPLTWDAFHRVTAEMGLTAAEADALSHESSKRITIIRRRLSTVAGVRLPRWAETSEQAATLIGLALAGGWLWDREGDRQTLCALTGRSEEDLENQMHRLALLEDAPIFLIAGAGGLISRHDAFPALKHAVTPGLINRFFKVLAEVLEAPDPSLELPSERRWMANIYKKERPQSGRLRQQLVSTLVFLTQADSRIVGKTDVRSLADRLVEELFAAGDEAWLRLRDVLPGLAEAAPSAFLNATSGCLPRQAEDGGVWQLIKPTDSDSFAETTRLNVIWALERLAWNPDYFTRVAGIFATLSQRPLEDNLITKPAASLFSLFHPSAPQTDALEGQRARTLAALAKEHGEVVWRLCLQLVDQRLSYIRRTGRRGAPRESLEINPHPRGLEPDIRSVVLEVLLSRDVNGAEALQLIESSACFNDGELGQLWDRIEAWQRRASKAERSAARRSVLKSALWRARARPESKVQADPRAMEVFKALSPDGPAGDYAWLFDAMHIQGVEAVWPEISGWREQEKRVEEERAKAIALLLEDETGHWLMQFAHAVEYPGSVARATAKAAPDQMLILLITHLFSHQQSEWAGRLDFVDHLLGGLGNEVRSRLLAKLESEWQDAPGTLLELLLLCHPDETTWKHVDLMSAHLRASYWARLNRRVHPDENAAVIRASKELLKAGRPVAALRQASIDPRILDTALIIELLETVAKVPGPQGDGLVDPGTIEDYFEALDERGDAERTTVLQLEFLYARVLERTPRGAAAISKEIATNPKVFIEAAEHYLRRDDGVDDEPEEEHVEHRRFTLLHWGSILDNCSLPPGSSDDDGCIDADRLRGWLSELCPLLEGVGRLNNGLYQVGEWLGRTRREVDGQWPSLEVARVLEPYAKPTFKRGLALGILNSRGVHSRGHMAGGTPERVLAEKFRNWRRRLEIDCPNLADIFEEIAQSYDLNAARNDQQTQFNRAASE